MTTTESTDRWRLRTVLDDLRQRYVDEGWWTDESLGQLVAEGLSTRGDIAFEVHSDVRPWTGTFADVDAKARALAGSLQARGVGPGDVVVFQLPNWVEAGIVFWASAYLGAVVVPIVHFYGPKEVAYILDATDPSVVVTADRFGHSEYLGTYETLLAERPDATWLVAGDTPTDELPGGASPFEGRARRRSARRSTRRRSRRTRHRGLHVGNHPRPQGASSTPTAPSGSSPDSSTTSSPWAGRRRSPARRSATSSAWSTPSCSRCCASARCTWSTCGTPARCWR